MALGALPARRDWPRGPRSSASTVEASQAFASTTRVLGTLASRVLGTRASQRGHLARLAAASGENRSRHVRQ